MVAPQANYAVVYVNGNQIGLYTSAESINDPLLIGTRIQERSWKCNCQQVQAGNLILSDLVFQGNDSTNYTV